MNEYTNYNGTAVGNDLTGDVQTFNGWAYTYDAQNRLRHATNSATGADAKFYYDGLNRQVARTVTAAQASPTPTPTATPSPSPTPTPTPTPTATPPPNQCAAVTFSTTGGNGTTMQVYLSTTTSGATIFMTLGTTAFAGNPTHTGSTAGSGTFTYAGTPLNVAAGTKLYIEALAYKSGLTDSVVTTFIADNSGGGGGAMMMMGGMMAQSMTMVTTTTYSVWDGDWAILEEYDSTGARIQGYVEGYHGIVKTLVDNIYYYQDELGSTSHIASSTGALIESYHYDVYGKPRVYDSGGNYQAGATPRVQFLQGGARWMPEIGLYDDRNRFMSPDLGRFLQPDPIGFQGDASNLYRYCGNNWGNRIDRTGLYEGTPNGSVGRSTDLSWKETENDLRDDRSFQEKLSADEVEHQANVDSQHPGNVRHSKAEAEKAAAEGIVKQKYDTWQAAGKAGALADYKATEAAQLEGHPQEFWGCILINHQTNEYEITGPFPGTGSGAYAVAGVSGGFSDMNCPPPAGYGLVGGHYSHMHSDMIRGNAKDIKALNESHWRAVVAAPRPTGERLPSPMYQGYDGWTHQFYDDPYFQKLD